MGVLPLHPSPRVATDAPYVDARGIIQNIVGVDLGSAVLITSKAGTFRARHAHREDWHYCYVVSGAIEYFERRSLVMPDSKVARSQAPTKRYVFKAGDLFWTGPATVHEMRFHEDTVFLTLANLHRSPAEYEADLVRVADGWMGEVVEGEPETGDGAGDRPQGRVQAV